VYHEPKGLQFSSPANGVPVVQPRHGAFPEMLERQRRAADKPRRRRRIWRAALPNFSPIRSRRFELAQRGHAAVHAQSIRSIAPPRRPRVWKKKGK